ncbi:MAG: hypothetical protein ACREJO_02210 [Phycisphaerales bacterium]
MQTPAPHLVRRLAARRGSIYVVVLGVSLLVTMIGLGGVSANSAIARSINAGSDSSRARWTAQSALELARQLIDADPLWRTNRANGAWVTDSALGKATYSISVVNPSGALNRTETDTVVVTAIGKFGTSVHTMEAQLVADSSAPSCLSCAAAVGGSITFNSTDVTCTDSLIASNSAVTAVTASVNAKIEASLTALGLTFKQSAASLCPQRAMPGSGAFNYYLANGTSIPVTSLPGTSGARTISRVLISPAVNPFSGGTNSQGIYVIDAGGADLTILDCRIVGTLVIINPGTTCSIKSSVVWEPAVANYPCLMVRGNANIRTSASALSENSGGSNINVNPASTPYPYNGGISNSSTSDTFPSSIEGLVYVSGNLTTATSVSCRMLLVGGNLTAGGVLVLNYDSTYNDTPPPGFATVKMRPLLGGARQVTQ